MEEERIPADLVKQETTGFQRGCSIPLDPSYLPTVVRSSGDHLGIQGTSPQNQGDVSLFGDDGSVKMSRNHLQGVEERKMVQESLTQDQKESKLEPESPAKFFTAIQTTAYPDPRRASGFEFKSELQVIGQSPSISSNITKSHLLQGDLGATVTQDKAYQDGQIGPKLDSRPPQMASVPERTGAQNGTGSKDLPPNRPMGVSPQAQRDDQVMIDIPIARKPTDVQNGDRQGEGSTKPKGKYPLGSPSEGPQLPSRALGIFNNVVQHQTSIFNTKGPLVFDQANQDATVTNKHQQESGYVNWSKPSNQTNSGGFKAVSVSVLETKTAQKPDHAILASGANQLFDPKSSVTVSSVSSVHKQVLDLENSGKFATPASRSKQDHKPDHPGADGIGGRGTHSLKNNCYCGQASKNSEGFLTCVNFSRCQGKCHKSCVEWNEADYGPFECPSCLILSNDPMREVVTPLVGPTLMEPEATFTFKVTLPKPAPPAQGRGKALPVPVYDVEMRCIKLGGPRMYLQCWPQNIKLTLNSTNVFDSIYMDQSDWYKSGREAPRLRKLVPNINAVMRGNNFTLKIESVSDLNTRYMFCVCLVRSHCLRSFFRKMSAENTLEMRDAQKKLVSLLYGPQAPKGRRFSENRPKTEEL